MTIIMGETDEEATPEYNKENVRQDGSNRRYSSLLHDRPRNFMKHCLAQMPPNINEIAMLKIIHNGNTFRV